MPAIAGVWVADPAGATRAARNEISNPLSQANPERQVSSDTVSPTRTAPPMFPPSSRSSVMRTCWHVLDAQKDIEDMNLLRALAAAAGAQP